MPLRLDIVVPTYNRPHLIRPLVTVLAGQCLEGDRIFVVWQGPEPPAPSPSPVQYLSLGRPNLPAARNRGFKESHADIVLFLDDDVVPAPDLVSRHRACYSDPEVAGVAGYVDDPIFIRERPRPSIIDLSRGDCVQNFACSVSQKTASAMGANMSFRKSALAAIGGFDEHFKRNALWEEVDCCLRLLAAGNTLWYCADAKVKHCREDKGGCRGDRNRYGYLYHQFANTAYFALRFAEPENYGLWFTFWKYRLEYYSRIKRGRDFLAVAAGMAGAAGGIARFFGSLAWGSPRRKRIDRAALQKTLVALGSEG